MKTAYVPEQRAKLTPPQLAAIWGVDTGKIIAWIRSGELAAIDASTRRNQRPRFLIDKCAIEAFERARAVVPVPASTPRRKRVDSGVTEYFQ
jgi:hypothetical protein